MNSNELVLGRFFRWAGVLALVAAGLAFLVEGWSDSRVLPRQIAWAGITLALVLSGVVSGRRFRDPVGARVGLGLGAATLPLHFAQLGSALFEVQLHGVATPSSVLFSVSIVLLLVPVLALGGAALVRRWVLPFTLLLFAFSCPLLFTTRAADTIAWLAFGELALLVALELLVFSRRSDLEGVEGAAVRTLLSIPLFILLGRNAFYESTPLWLGAIFATPGVGLLLGSKWLDQKRHFRAGAAFLGGALLSIAGCLATASWATVPVAVAASMLATLALSRRSGSPGVAGWCGTAALAFALASDFGGSEVLVMSVGIALSVGYVGLAYERRALAWCAANVCSMFGLMASILVAHIRFPVYFAWLLPALAGIALLVLGSSLQSPHGRGGRIWASLARHFLGERESRQG